MLTPATIDGNMQGIPTTAPDSIRVFHTTGSASKFWLSLFWQKAKTCNCDTVWRRLSLTGAESGPFGFKVLKDPGKAWGYSVHHWWCPCLIAMVDHCNGYSFCLVFMDGDWSDFSFLVIGMILVHLAALHPPADDPNALVVLTFQVHHTSSWVSLHREIMFRHHHHNQWLSSSKSSPINTGVSIISKKLVFYKWWYLRFEFL